ncbi:MAG: hypothetical protein JOZ19_06025 [Rubrobacter sp.]|nr:hypothetical protein [Rubrobacter sp.]
MARQNKRRPAEVKRPIELTDDEVLEHLFGKEVRDKLKETARKARKPDIYGKKPPHA